MNPDSKKKQFYRGVVTEFKRPYYRVVYDDGDFEDMTPTQVSQNVRRKIKPNAVTQHKTGEQMEYRQLIKDPYYKETLTRLFADEMGNLFQGVGKNTDGSQQVKGKNTCFWIKKEQLPKGRTVTYARIVCENRPQKPESPNRTRITACGNLITDYPGNVSTDTAGLETIKIHWNSTILTPKEKYMTIDISNMYLNTRLNRYEYMRFHLKDIPQEIIDEYNLRKLADPNGWCYCEIRKAIYGLSQSGYLAFNQL